MDWASGTANATHTSLTPCYYWSSTHLSLYPIIVASGRFVSYNDRNNKLLKQSRVGKCTLLLQTANTKDLSVYVRNTSTQCNGR